MVIVNWIHHFFGFLDLPYLSFAIFSCYFLDLLGFGLLLDFFVFPFLAIDFGCRFSCCYWIQELSSGYHEAAEECFELGYSSLEATHSIFSACAKVSR